MFVADLSFKRTTCTSIISNQWRTAVSVLEEIADLLFAIAFFLAEEKCVAFRLTAMFTYLRYGTA